MQANCSVCSQPIRGFSLTELLVVMVIAAIISSLAWPSYRAQIMKTRRSTGTGALVELAAKMEHYYLDRGTYAGATLGNSTADIYPATAASGYYQLKIVTQNDLQFLVTAIPTRRGKQHRDKCVAFTLDSLGNRGLQQPSNGLDQSRCWY